MSYPINTTIPSAPDDPADDQPIMQQNTANTFTYLTVDHIDPGSAGNGFHKQSSYIATTQPANLVNAVSHASSNGIAYVNSANNNDLHYINASPSTNSNYPLNLIKAYGYYTVSAPNIALVNGFNMTSPGTYSAVGKYAIFFSQPNGSTNYGYLISAQDSVSGGGGDVRSSVIVTHVAGGVNLEFTKRTGGSNSFYDPISFTLVILSY